MSKNRNRAIVLSIVLLTISLLVVTIPLAKAQFVLASWSYPDEYGQGVYGFRFYENSTGSWVAAPFYTDIGAFYFLHYYDTGYELNWSGGVAIKLRCYTLLNLTLTGAINETDGQSYQRHSVVVTTPPTVWTQSLIVFSASNFTYYDVTPYGDMPQYEYEVVLDFLPVGGSIYTVTVIYEIFY